jgi:hypothetical protein
MIESLPEKLLIVELRLYTQYGTRVQQRQGIYLLGAVV